MRTLLLSFLVFGFLALNGEEPKIDLTTIKHIAPKCRVQDKDYNSNLPVVDLLIAKGKDAIPILIGSLEDERPLKDGTIDFWSRVSVGDLAHIILVDFFTDETCGEQTVPGADMWMGSEKDPSVASSSWWYDFLKKEGRPAVKKYWQGIWKKYKDYIRWDDKKRCFVLVPFDLEGYFNKKYESLLSIAKEGHVNFEKEALASLSEIEKQYPEEFANRPEIKRMLEEKKESLEKELTTGEKLKEELSAMDFSIEMSDTLDRYSAFVIRGGALSAYDDGVVKKQKLLLVLTESFTNKILQELDISHKGYGAALIWMSKALLKIVNADGTYYVIAHLQRGGDGDHEESKMSVYQIVGTTLKKLTEQNIHEPSIEVNGNTIEVISKHVITFCYGCDGWEAGDEESTFLIPMKVTIKKGKVSSKCNMGKKEKQEMIKQFEAAKAARLKYFSTFKHGPREEKYINIKETSEEFYSIINK